MPWVALEGKFAQHPKLLKFSPVNRWTWVELLCYCAEYRTKGVVPKRIRDVIPGATPGLLKLYAQAGLLDLTYDDANGAGYAVHDWDEFNGTGKERRDAKERKRRQRAKDNDEEPDDDVPF